MRSYIARASQGGGTVRTAPLQKSEAPDRRVAHDRAADSSLRLGASGSRAFGQRSDALAMLRRLLSRYLPSPLFRFGKTYRRLCSQRNGPSVGDTEADII